MSVWHRSFDARLLARRVIHHRQTMASHLLDHHQASARLQLAALIFFVGGGVAALIQCLEKTIAHLQCLNRREMGLASPGLSSCLCTFSTFFLESIGLLSHPQKPSLECSLLLSEHLKQQAGKNVGVLIIFWKSFYAPDVTKTGRGKKTHPTP